MVSTLYPALRKILLQNGCTFVRQGKGSHELWTSPLSKQKISVPITIVSRHTANDILKTAGIAQRL